MTFLDAPVPPPTPAPPRVRPVAPPNEIVRDGDPTPLGRHRARRARARESDGGARFLAYAIVGLGLFLGGYVVGQNEAKKEVRRAVVERSDAALGRAVRDAFSTR